MIYGVTDIGTNTIRAVIYEENVEIKAIDELVFESEILINTKDNILTDDGIKKLVLVLKKSTEFFLKNNVEKIYFFATSAMRDVKNFLQINDEVYKTLSIKIDLLEEKDEILCDFYGIKLILGENSSGEAIDLGGGSCQIISFENGELKSGKSLKIGVKRLYQRFSKSPSALVEYVSEELKKAPIKESENLYVMGGTSKNILATLKILHPEIKNSFEVEKLEEIKNVDFSKGRFFEIYKNRVNTIAYGVCVIGEIAEKCKAKRITVINSDARKGYIAFKKGKWLWMVLKKLK